jgi:prolyl 4-hydroxylase
LGISAIGNPYVNVSLSETVRRASAGDGAAQILLARHLEAAGQRQDAEAWLRRASDAGNVEAMLALAEHLLAGPASASPAVLDEVRRLVIPAAEVGNGPAAYLLARMFVSDITSAKNWGIALGYLARAATAGNLPAQVELAFMAGEAGLANAVVQGQKVPPQVWDCLHGTIDCGAWTEKTPPVRVVSEEGPFIAVVDNFISPEICEWIIHWSRNRLEPAKSYDNGRSVCNHMTVNPELDFVVTSVIHRVAAITKVPINGKEGTSVLRYLPGEHFEPHFDFLDPSNPALADQILEAGQRVVTFIVYLSDDFEGGETYFPEVKYRFKGRKGDAVFFRNLTTDGTPDLKALHAGLAPASGEKWVFVRVGTHIPTPAF